MSKSENQKNPTVFIGDVEFPLSQIRKAVSEIDPLENSLFIKQVALSLLNQIERGSVEVEPESEISETPIVGWTAKSRTITLEAEVTNGKPEGEGEEFFCGKVLVADEIYISGYWNDWVISDFTFHKPQKKINEK